MNIELIAPVPLTLDKDGYTQSLARQVFEGHFLYFRKADDWNALHERYGDRTFTKTLKLACFLEIYGQIDAAIAILRLAEANTQHGNEANGLKRIIDCTEYLFIHNGFVLCP